MENKNMTKCKACNADIAKGVNKCPHCGKDQRNWFMRHKVLSVIIILVVLGSIGALNGNDEKDTAVKTSTNDTVQTKQETTQNKTETNKDESKEEQTSYKMGDVIKTDKFEITINSIEQKSQVGDEYIQKTPSEGGVYVAVQWQYKNISDKPIGSFSVPRINLLDKNKTKYSTDIDASGTFATEVNPDEKIVSDLNPGITVKSADVFEVSKDSFNQSGWKLLINADKDINVDVN